DRRAVLAAVLLGPADAEPAVGAELAQHARVLGSATFAGRQLGDVLRRHELREVLPQTVAQLPLLGRQVEIHASGLLSRAARGRVPRRPTDGRRRDAAPLRAAQRLVLDVLPQLVENRARTKGAALVHVG